MEQEHLVVLEHLEIVMEHSVAVAPSMGLEECLYQVTTHINNTCMVIQSPATFTPKRSMSDHRWSMDFINDTIQTLRDMHQSIADIAENICSIHTCAEKINGVNPEGIPEYQFT